MIYGISSTTYSTPQPGLAVKSGLKALTTTLKSVDPTAAHDLLSVLSGASTSQTAGTGTTQSTNSTSSLMSQISSIMNGLSSAQKAQMNSATGVNVFNANGQFNPGSLAKLAHGVRHGHGHKTEPAESGSSSVNNALTSPSSSSTIAVQSTVAAGLGNPVALGAPNSGLGNPVALGAPTAGASGVVGATEVAGSGGLNISA